MIGLDSSTVLEVLKIYNEKGKMQKNNNNVTFCDILSNISFTYIKRKTEDCLKLSCKQVEFKNQGYIDQTLVVKYIRQQDVVNTKHVNINLWNQ